MRISSCQWVYIQPQTYSRSVVIQSSFRVQLLPIKQIRHGLACAVFFKQHLSKRYVLCILGYSSLSITPRREPY